MHSFRSIDALASKVASKIRFNAATEVAPRIDNKPPPPHSLTLYEYEASPWCRLVREHLTILDLNAQIRPCPRQTFRLEGAFSRESRFRPQAMQHLKRAHNTDDLTFPLLVDETDTPEAPKVLCQSYDILQHLWTTYGQNVLPTPSDQRRPDQTVNSTRIPFAIRFVLLSAPSYLRPWPRCGLMRTPSLMPNEKDGGNGIILYQAEGCHESRLIREVLCTLELPYLSISAGKGSAVHPLPHGNGSIPILLDNENIFEGSEDTVKYLWEQYGANEQKRPSWFDKAPKPNLGRAGSFSVGAWTAFVKGSRAFVPSDAMK